MTSRRSDRPAGHAEPGQKCFLPPCQVKCPIREDIQRTNILISLLPHDPETASQAVIEIGDSLYQKNPLFTVCGYVCGICELACSYPKSGGAIRRRLLKRFLSERYQERLKGIDPFLPGNLGKVAIIGGGPAGLMAAFDLSRRGYRTVIHEAGDSLGGALRLIPHYRLPGPVLDDAIAALVRVAGVEVHVNSPFGEEGFDLDLLRKEGSAAVFIAAGSPNPRVLEYEGGIVQGQQLHGVMYGHSFLYELAHGALPDRYLAGRKVIVAGGGNVAFDVARSSRRLGALTSVVCLESASGDGRERLPADPHEVRLALEEGVEIIHSRGVSSKNSDGENFMSISAPRCTRVYDSTGFNPAFDVSDSVEITGDFLIIAVGQGPERSFLQNEGLLDAGGRLAFDPLTLQSLTDERVFIGGDMLRIGFMVDAMRDGLEAAESIDRFIRGADLREGRDIEYTSHEPPSRHLYKAPRDIPVRPPEKRLDFNLYERGFSLEEAIEESRRCLACGPCASCEACIGAGIRVDIPICEVIDDLCSGCGICVSACPFGAASVEQRECRVTSVTDLLLCRGCGLCVAACPASARRLTTVDCHDIE